MFLPDFDAPVVPLAHVSPVVVGEIADEVDLALDEIVAKLSCQPVDLHQLALVPIVNLDVAVLSIFVFIGNCMRTNAKHL